MAAPQLTSFLSPNSNLRSQIATLDSAISTLRANGMQDQADMFYSNLQQAIANKDIDTLKAYSGQLMELNSKNLTVPAEARTLKDENQIVRSIEQLASVADSRNIAIPPADLNAAANAFAKKDTKQLNAISNSISKLIEDGIKIQQNEQKSQVQLADGSTILIGSQSGNRYDNTGNPIPFGNRNEQLFTSLASQVYSPRAKKIMEAMSGAGSDLVGSSVIGSPMQSQPDIGARPEVYQAMQEMQPTEDAIARNIRLNAEAKALYDQGDRAGALNTLRGLKAQGLFGGDLTDADLDEYFKQVSPTPPASETNPQETSTPTASETNPQETSTPTAPTSRKPIGSRFKSGQ